MLETFKTRLKAKSTAAGAQNLTNARLDAMSAKLNAKFPDLTDEAEHDAKIDDFYDAEMFKEIAALDDFQRAKAKREADKKKEPEKKPEEKKAEEPPKDEVPEWAKSLISEVQHLRKEKVQGTIAEKLKNHDKVKSIPQSFYKGRTLPEKEEDLEAFIETLQTDYAEFEKETGFKKGQDVDQNLLKIGTPIGGNGDAKQKVSPLMKSYLEKNKKAAS